MFHCDDNLYNIIVIIFQIENKKKSVRIGLANRGAVETPSGKYNKYEKKMNKITISGGASDDAYAFYEPGDKQI